MLGEDFSPYLLLGSCPQRQTGSAPILSTALPDPPLARHYWPWWDTALMICLSPLCSVSGLMPLRACCIPPAEGRQYHHIASRGRDSMHLTLPMLGWEPAGLGNGPQIPFPTSSQKTLPLFHTLLRPRPAGILRVAEGR